MGDPTTNPPIYEGTPADGDLVQYRASDNSWQLVSIADAGAIIVPQTHIAAQAAPTALTSSQNATTNASAPSSGYVQAEAASSATLANALKVSYNAAQADIATLRTEVAALVTLTTTLLSELQTAEILSAS